MIKHRLALAVSQSSRWVTGFEFATPATTTGNMVRLQIAGFDLVGAITREIEN